VKHLLPFPHFLSNHLLFQISLFHLSFFHFLSVFIFPYPDTDLKQKVTYSEMSYGGRYADYDDEPSRRQAPREEVSFREQLISKLTISDRINRDTKMSPQPPLKGLEPMTVLDQPLEKSLFPSEVVLLHLLPLLADSNLLLKVLPPEYLLPQPKRSLLCRYR
jgi:hypothetical protein